VIRNDPSEGSYLRYGRYIFSEGEGDCQGVEWWEEKGLYLMTLGPGRTCVIITNNLTMAG
jgi:hypothetical protein